MNERIKELMPKPWTFPYPDNELYTKEQFEHFAKLIVKECANVLVKIHLPDHDLHIVSKNYADQIKQHFGVK